MGFSDIFKSSSQVARDYVKSDKFIEDIRKDIEKYMPPPPKYSIMRTTDMKWLCTENNEVKWKHSSYNYDTFTAGYHPQGKIMISNENKNFCLKYNSDTDTISLTNNRDEAVYKVVSNGNTCVYYGSETYMIIYHPKT